MPLDPRADSLLASFEDIKATLAGAAHACAFGVAAREGQIPAEGHTYQGLNADDAASLSAQQHLGRSIDPGPHAQQPHRYSSAATKGQELGAQTAAGTVGDGGRDAYRRQESVAGDAERSRKQQTVTPAARSTGDVIGRMVRERRHADSERAQRLAGAAALKEQTLRRRRELEEEAEVCVVAEEQAQELLRREQRRAMQVARTARDRRWAKAKAAAATRLALEERAEAGRVELRWRIEASKAQSAIEQLRSDKDRATMSIVEARRHQTPQPQLHGQLHVRSGSGAHSIRHRSGDIDSKKSSSAVTGVSFGRTPTGRILQPTHRSTPLSRALSAKGQAKLSRSEQQQRSRRRGGGTSGESFSNDNGDARKFEIHQSALVSAAVDPIVADSESEGHGVVVLAAETAARGSAVEGDSTPASASELATAAQDSALGIIDQQVDVTQTLHSPGLHDHDGCVRIGGNQKHARQYQHMRGDGAYGETFHDSSTSVSGNVVDELLDMAYTLTDSLEWPSTIRRPTAMNRGCSGFTNA